MSLRRRGYLVEIEECCEEEILIEGESGLAKLKKKYDLDTSKKREATRKGHGSIGYSRKKGCWCGWSHRAFHCFPIGHTVKKGDLPSRFLGKRVKSVADSERFAAAFSREVS